MTPKSNSPEAAAAVGLPATAGVGTTAVWDLPLRLFHWSLVLSVIGAFVTIKVGGGWMAWHMRFGYVILTLLLFRLVWGFIGGRHARFADFIVSPGTLLRYLRGRPGQAVSPGHNPLGSLSVIAMIVLFLTQATLGLFSNDDIFTEGPLAHLISKEASDAATGLHKLGENLLLALVAVHLAAIAFYRFARGQRLVRAMISGGKDDLPAEPGAGAGAGAGASAGVGAGAGTPTGLAATGDPAPSATRPVTGEAAPSATSPATGMRVPVDSTGLRLTAAVTLAACAGLVYWLVTSF